MQYTSNQKKKLNIRSNCICCVKTKKRSQTHWQVYLISLIIKIANKNKKNLIPKLIRITKNLKTQKLTFLSFENSIKTLLFWYYSVNSTTSDTSLLTAQLHKLEAYFKKGSRMYELNVEQAFRPTTTTTVSRHHSKSSMSNDEAFNEYLVKFYQVLFSQFKSKKDNFKINEQVLLDVHAAVVKRDKHVGNGYDDDDEDEGSHHHHHPNHLKIEHLDDIDLLTKFELYAECVHKYLPQIRQHNKYLLFHYVWTMQVQYLTPFFNYICDLYQAYE